jgi:hypothetical protein
MIGDHHGRTTGNATLLVRAMDGILGTYKGIAQRVPDDERDNHPATVTNVGTWQIRRKPVLGGLINEYVRAA